MSINFRVSQALFSSLVTIERFLMFLLVAQCCLCAQGIGDGVVPDMRLSYVNCTVVGVANSLRALEHIP